MLLRFLLPVLLLASSAVSCTTIQAFVDPNSAMEGQVGQMTELRLNLESSWQRIEDRIAKAEVDIDRFGQTGLTASPAELKIIAETVQASAATVAAHSLENPEIGAEVLKKTTALATSQASAEVVNMSEEGVRIMGELKAGLRSDIEDLAARAKAVVVEGTQIQVKAKALGKTYEKNPLLSGQAERDFEAMTRDLDGELDALRELSANILGEADQMKDRLGRISAQFDGKIEGFMALIE